MTYKLSIICLLLTLFFNPLTNIVASPIADAIKHRFFYIKELEIEKKQADILFIKIKLQAKQPKEMLGDCSFMIWFDLDSSEKTGTHFRTRNIGGDMAAIVYYTCEKKTWDARLVDSVAHKLNTDVELKNFLVMEDEIRITLRAEAFSENSSCLVLARSRAGKTVMDNFPEKGVLEISLKK